jgi:hypothetical protein
LALAGLLSAASLLGALRLAWPDNSGTTVPTIGAALPQGAISPALKPDTRRESATGAAAAAAPEVVAEMEDPQRIAAAISEPALLDLLEDASSTDPTVQYEASRLLQAGELSPP